ncbi:MAG: hypothetical protein KDA80_08880 [Planctomycetaceae bacterium]|nr:hypothetical protein [Planctomycetaceae bacterium]
MSVRITAAAEPSFYLIGNSLTWDTVPSKLDGDVQWHVDCGKSLPFIYQNPEDPCVGSSTLWPQALKDKQYDYLSVQPHYGSTLDEDVSTIGKWLQLQPNAVVIIHAGWARHASRAEEYALEETDGKLVHSPAYLAALTGTLRGIFPGREFRQTHTTDLLEMIASDIENGEAPVEKLEDLYRDAIHMNTTTGRYLMHNAMRRAMDQPRSSDGFANLDPSLKEYFDRLLDQLPELSKSKTEP